VQVVDFLEYAWPKHLPWWHVPNGEKRDHKTRVDRRTGKTVRYSPTGQKLKAMGLKPGVADLCFVMPNGKGAFLELKRPGEDLSEDQEKFRDAVRPLGCGWAVADNFDEVQRILTRWLAAYGLQLRARGFVPPPDPAAAPLFDGAPQ
jgi:hypothetical protein